MRVKDADALLEYLMINMGWHDEDGIEVDDWEEKREIIKDLIDGVPTVDAVPVVRCKDCKWWEGKRWDSSSDPQYGYCHACKHAYYSENWEISIRRQYKANWFCADGERRESDEQ